MEIDLTLAIAPRVNVVEDDDPYSFFNLFSMKNFLVFVLGVEGSNVS